jgi:anti-sigma B factor antagonist
MNKSTDLSIDFGHYELWKLEIRINKIVNIETESIMTINAEKNNEKAVLKIEGRLDTTTAPSLEKVINELPADVTNLILDMKELVYVSSAGLRVLLSAQKKMNKLGSMKLTGVCEDIMEVFDMTGFADILDIEK